MGPRPVRVRHPHLPPVCRGGEAQHHVCAARESHGLAERPVEGVPGVADDLPPVLLSVVL